MTILSGKWWTSIQSRLILLLLSILIPVLAIQGYIYYNNYQDQRQLEFQANLEVARAVSKGFESIIKDVLHQELAIGLALTSSRPMTSGDITRLLETSRDFAAVRDFTWLNPQGQAIYSSNPNMIGVDYSDRSYFREVARDREWMVGELILARTTGEPVFGIARGIRDGKGTLRGIVSAVILPEKLAGKLAIERRKGGGFAVVDNKGMLVYRYPAIAATWEERNWLSQYPWLEKVFQGEEIKNTRAFANFERKKRLLAATPVPSIGWVVTAATREEDLTASILRSMGKSILLFLLVSFVAFLSALVYSRKITNSITTLRAYALALGQGEMRGQVKINHVSEFQDLADAFDTMAEKVLTREKDLRESEARFRSVLDNSQDVIYRLNIQTGRYDYISPSAETITGFSPAELMAMNSETSLAMVHPEDLPGMQAIQARALDSGKVEMEYRQQTKYGNYRWLSNHISIVKDDAGVPLYRDGNIRDITESKQAEMTLKERTQQLEDANKELESFTYTVAHDLKAPLRAIDGFSRMLLKKHGDHVGEDAARMLSIVRSNTETMNVLIDDLLSFSRVLRNKMTILEINMNVLVSQVWDDIKAANQKQELEVKIENLLPGQGDRTLIRQVIFNLISNAVKFTKNRKPGIIEVSSYNERGEVVYCIKDNGVGFDMAYYNKLFGVFQRLHSHEEYEGTGVGLAIVQRIISRHGGHVWAEGEVDKGAAFYFTLPSTPQN